MREGALHSYPYLRTIGCLSCLLVLGSFLGSIGAHAQRFVEISAEIQTVTYRSGHTNDAARAVRKTFSLVCIVGTNEWRIDNNFPVNAEVKWLFDGTNVYENLHLTNQPAAQMTARLRELKLASVPFEQSKSNVIVTITPSIDGHPLGNVGVNIPWLAFCSGTYLKRPGRLLPLPVATLRHAPDGFGYSDRTVTFEDDLGLPRSVDLFTSKSRYEASVSNFIHKTFHGTRDAEIGKHKTSGFSEDILKFHYAVTKSTNFLGWNFPLQFEYLQNEPGGDGNWVPRYGGFGKVISIRASAKPESIFVTDKQLNIVDRRFRHDTKNVDSIVYRSTNAYAMPTNDLALQARFAARVERTPIPQTALRSRVRWIITALLFLTAVIPLIVICLRQKTHQNKNYSP